MTQQRTLYQNLPFLNEMKFKEVEDFIDDGENDDFQKCLALHKFSNEFLMDPNYWFRFLIILDDMSPDLMTEAVRACRIKALNQFYSVDYGFMKDKHIMWDNYAVVLAQCETYETYPQGIELLEEALTFPHWQLEMVFEAYVKLSAKPITKDLIERYDKASEIYLTLYASTFDEAWFEALEAIDNFEIIVINIEYFLGIYYSCKKLWRYYIELLRTRDPEAMLRVYLRYNRFFIGDLDMIEEYRSEIEKYGLKIAVTNFWMDTINFELSTGTLDSSIQIFKRALMFMIQKDLQNCKNGKAMVEYMKKHNGEEELFQMVLKAAKVQTLTEKAFKKRVLPKFNKIMTKIEGKKDVYIPWLREILELSHEPPKLDLPRPQKLNIKFEPSSTISQQFSLPLPLILQILKNAKATVLRNLQNSCKQLYRIQPTPICHQLGVSDSVKSQFFQHSLFLSLKDLDSPLLNKLYISNCLDWIVLSDRTALSKLIPKIYKCSAQFIHIEGQDMTLKELKLITGNVKNLHFCQTTIFDAEGKVMPYADIKKAMKPATVAFAN